MSIFRTIRDTFRPRPPQGAPYGLTDSEIAALRRLRVSEDFQVFQSTLDKIVKLYSEALLASTSSYTDSAWKHKIAGIRQAGALPDEVIQRIDQKREHERKHTERRERDSESGLRSALYGTPFGASRSDLFSAR